jgi:hypothetical protein
VNEAPEFRRLSVADILNQVSVLFVERNDEYKDNYKKVGRIYEVFFPEGLTLRTKSDFERFALFMQMTNKMMRYSVNFRDHPSPDHLRDLIANAAMLLELDQ